jgi:ATP-binding cassette subfamily F protein uup
VPLVSLDGIDVAFGHLPLVERASLQIDARERIAVIGRNGSGKSTLLKVINGELAPDAGSVWRQPGLKTARLEQDVPLSSARSVFDVVAEGHTHHLDEDEAWLRDHHVDLVLSRLQLPADAVVDTLSGGWRRRVLLARALVGQPDVLLLDEPTNHLDLAGIEWLESELAAGRFACVVVSHDRYFLENVATEMGELSRVYPDGILRVQGNYSEFLVKKEEFLHAQSKRQEALENLVHNEIEWLRRGAKARTRKSKARIGKAHDLMEELADLNARTRGGAAKIDFSATDRQTKRLVELQGVRYSIGGRELFDGLDFIVTAGMRVGLVGPNGSGKTTLLRLLRGEVAADGGQIRKADALRVVYFDQNRPLDLEVTLRRALAPDSDSVIYQDRITHVASWAARFLFTGEQLNQPVGRLSGGERARVLIAQLMLQPADVLLLDEPTNDLDIPTLEILEESLLEFRGALVLVTHDRYMLDRVSTVVLGLDGLGNAERFADYSQWEAWQEEQLRVASDDMAATKPTPATAPNATVAAKKKLSYMEAREYSTIEQRIADAEQLLKEKQAVLEDPAIVSNAARLVSAHTELEEAQKALDGLIERWTELEEKTSGLGS